MGLMSGPVGRCSQEIGLHHPAFAGNTWELAGVVYTSCLHLVSKAVVIGSSAIRRSEARSQTGIKASVRMAQETPKPGRILIPLGGLIHNFLSPCRPGGTLQSYLCLKMHRSPLLCTTTSVSGLVCTLLAIKDTLSLLIALLHLSVTVPSSQLHIYLIHLNVSANPFEGRK